MPSLGTILGIEITLYAILFIISATQSLRIHARRPKTLTAQKLFHILLSITALGRVVFFSLETTVPLFSDFSKFPLNTLFSDLISTISYVTYLSVVVFWAEVLHSARTLTVGVPTAASSSPPAPYVVEPMPPTPNPHAPLLAPAMMKRTPSYTSLSEREQLVPSSSSMRKTPSYSSLADMNVANARLSSSSSSEHLPHMLHHQSNNNNLVNGRNSPVPKPSQPLSSSATSVQGNAAAAAIQTARLQKRLRFFFWATFVLFLCVVTLFNVFSYSIHRPRLYAWAILVVFFPVVATLLAAGFLVYGLKLYREILQLQVLATSKERELKKIAALTVLCTSVFFLRAVFVAVLDAFYFDSVVMQPVFATVLLVFFSVFEVLPSAIVLGTLRKMPAKESNDEDRKPLQPAITTPSKRSLYF